jgi:hypothetical protein
MKSVGLGIGNNSGLKFAQGLNIKLEERLEGTEVGSDGDCKFRSSIIFLPIFRDGLFTHQS